MGWYLFIKKVSHLLLEQRRYLDNIINNFIAAKEAGDGYGRDADNKDCSV